MDTIKRLTCVCLVLCALSHRSLCHTPTLSYTDILKQFANHRLGNTDTNFPSKDGILFLKSLSSELDFGRFVFGQNNFNNGTEFDHSSLVGKSRDRWARDERVADDQRRLAAREGGKEGGLTSDEANNDQVSSTCQRDLERAEDAFNNEEFWAENLFDSWGKPGPSILQGWYNLPGNYHQCRDVTSGEDEEEGEGSEVKGNYCVVTMTPPPQLATDDPEEVFSPALERVQLGTCMPKSCSEEDISSLMAQALVSRNVTSMHVMRTECLTGHREVTTATVIAIVVISILTVLVVAGTTYDIVYVQMPKWREEKEEETMNGHAHMSSGRSKGAGLIVSNEHVPLLGATIISHSRLEQAQATTKQVLVAFSAYSNGLKVLSTQEPKGAISCIHGIRFFSMTWVVLLHCFLFGDMFAVNMRRGTAEQFDKHSYDVIYSTYFNVDTFFVLSGFLVSYLKSRELMKKGLENMSWKKYYLHRLWRLTPPYMLYILFFLGLQRFFGEGELWANSQPSDKQYCEDNWWTNLLYINNLVKTEEQCLGQTWYLSNDMQFYVIAPLLFVSLFLRRAVGLAICGILIVVSWSVTVALSVDKDWTLSDSRILDDMDRWKYYYVAPYCRIPPFILGVLAGYLLAINHGKLRLRKWMVTLGWVAAFTLGLVVVYGVHDDVSGVDPSPKGVAAVYNALARSAWGLAICWLILACASGYGGPINSFLSWKPFIVLGKLSYTAYLIHINLITAYTGNMARPLVVNDVTLTMFYCAVLTVTLLISFVLVVTVEVPLLGLEKVLLH